MKNNVEGVAGTMGYDCLAGTMGYGELPRLKTSRAFPLEYELIYHGRWHVVKESDAAFTTIVDHDGEERDIETDLLYETAELINEHDLEYCW